MDIEPKPLYIHNQVPLAPKTTLRVGGPAAFFCLPQNFRQLNEAFTFARKQKIKPVIFGQGSNILVSDQGLGDLVIQLHGFDRIFMRSDGRLWVDAGVTVAALVNFAETNSYSGFEEFAGLPGTVGGAVCGNAGCHGKEFWQVLEAIRYFDGKGMVEIPAAKFLFLKDKSQLAMYDYRWSIFKDNPSWVIVSVALKFDSGDSKKIRADTEKFRRLRKSNQPKARSAGCIFKNPFVDGLCISAGKLIDEAGFKGKRLGGAQVSEVHANFVVNTGRAAAEDIYDLMLVIKERVEKHAREKLGLEIKLEPEIQILGEFSRKWPV